MADISKEAMDEARRLLENSSRVGISGIAAALQKLMDELDVQGVALHACIQHEFERAEKAEASKSELIREVRWWAESRAQAGTLVALEALRILAKHEGDHG